MNPKTSTGRRGPIRLSDEFLAPYERRQPDWGPLGWITYKRTYARWADRAQTRREEWHETVRRVVEGNIALDPRPRTPEVVQELTREAERMFDTVFHLLWTPPGRGLWISGTEFAKRHGDALVNCWAVAVKPGAYADGEPAKPSFPFVLAMDLLMKGGGVGFSVTHEHVKQLPTVKNPVRLHVVCDSHHPNVREVEPEPIPQVTQTYLRVEDSREGWWHALRVVIDSHFKAKRERHLVLDVSDVRAAGEAIRGFGGTAAGPGPLVQLLRDVNALLNDAVGVQLTPVQCTDVMNMIGRCVVAGNVRRCLPEGTRVWTTRGSVPIEQLTVADEVVTPAGQSAVRAIFDQGVQETVLVRHAFGAFECTANHRLAVFTGIGEAAFRRADELQPGDRLVWDSVGFDGAATQMPAAAPAKPRKAHDTNSQSITLPDLDEEIAWLIGVIHGDLHVYVPGSHAKTPNGYVSVACDQRYPEQIARVRRAFERFGVRVFEKQHQDGCVKVNVYSNQLAEYLLAHVKQPKVAPRVPEWIENAPRGIRGAYLAGVFDADGYPGDPSRSGTTVLAATVYPEFAGDLQRLAATLGIPVTNRASRPAKGMGQELRHVAPKGAESYARLIEHVFSRSTRGQAVRMPSRSTGGFGFPVEWIDASYGRPKHGAWASNAATVTVDRLRTARSYPERAADPVTAEAVVPSGRSVRTFDIEVEGIHQFTAEGFVVHNSAELSLGSADDLGFIAMKTNRELAMKHRWASNNSIAIDSTFEDFERIASAITLNGEPGIVNLELMRTRGRLVDEAVDPRNAAVIGTNPCVTGDTLVAVADGRGQVPIGELAAAGVDVPVYALDSDGRLVVRTMRHPRMTRQQAPVVRVTLDDGSTLTVTPNHKFRLKDGRYRRADELQSGDSLELLTRFQEQGQWQLAAGFEHSQTEQSLLQPGPAVEGIAAGDGIAWLRAQGYRAEILEGECVVHRSCEGCGAVLTVPAQLREICVCADCAATKQRQVGIFLDLKFELGRRPMRGEWVDRCQELGVTHEISRSSSPFRFYAELEQAAALHNHRVVSVEPAGSADVFNGTVDEFHNFFVGGFASTTADGKPKHCFVNNLNCGEIALSDGEACNLAEVFPARIEQAGASMDEVLRLALRYSKRITCAEYGWQITRDVIGGNRRVGVSLSGIADWQLQRGAADYEALAPELDRMYHVVRDADREYSAALGVPESVAVTTVKPSGCRPTDALTTFAEGILTLDEAFMATGHQVGEDWHPVDGTPLHVIQDGEERPVTQSYDNGFAEVYRVRTLYNITVEATAAHPWWVKGTHSSGGDPGHNGFKPLDAWRATADLQPGEVLEIVPGRYSSEQEADLRPVNALAISMRADATTIKQPERMNPDLAWLLGYLWGDRALSPTKFRIRFTDGRVENLRKAQRILAEQFGLDGTIHPASGARKAQVLEVGSKHLWHWLIVNGFSKLHADGSLERVPELVRRSSHETILAFLAGLIDADGCVAMKNDRENVVILSTADAAFAKHIQDVALAVGVVFGRSHQSQGANLRQRKSMWLMSSTPHSLPERFALLAKHSMKMRPELMAHPEKPWSHERTDGTRRRILGKIESVEPIGVMPTYDVEVDQEHWFYAGAVKSHNTVSLLTGSSPGLHYHYSPYVIRRIRFQEADPLVELLRMCGFPIEKDAYSPNTVVAEFPVKAPGADDAKFVSAGDVPLEQQFANQAALQRWWSDNSVSATLTFKPGERRSLPRLLREYRDQLKSTSLLPYSDHSYVQAPYEPISKEEYERRSAEIIAWPHQVGDQLHEQKRQEFDLDSGDECAGGSCPIR